MIATVVILYEYPFNERIRTYLRLEQLFRRLDLLISRDHPTDHHYALAALFEIMDVAARADLKSDVMKDLEKQKSALSALRGNPAIAEVLLQEVIDQLDADYSALHGQTGKAGQSLTENDWLMSIRSRIGIPGGTCEFDLPAYHAWQQLDPTRRQADLTRWVTPLGHLADSIRLLLKLMRDAGAPQRVMASAGHLQQTLPQGRTFQLMRLRIDSTLDLVPEISGNRLMVAVRLMKHTPGERLQVSHDDTPFELTLCA
jgi:cell division protein ZapD